jgi:hypothetical protein
LIDTAYCLIPLPGKLFLLEFPETSQAATDELMIDFLHWAAHELRNQINNVVSFLNLVQMSIEVDATHRYAASIGFHAISSVLLLITST